MGGPSTRGSPATAKSPRESAPGPLSHVEGAARESRPSSLKTQTADGRAPDVTVHSPLGGWSREIQMLTEEADRGSEAAVALLVDIIASEPNAAVRHQAVAALGRLNAAETELALTAALADDDVSVRVRAIRGLRGAGTETAAQSLREVLIGDADPQVRLAALRALASYPGRTMLQGLAKASSDPDGLVRETATRGLSWWKPRVPDAPEGPFGR